MKTKAELLEENTALKAENKRLERKIEILTQNVRGLLYDSDRDEQELKIVKSAHDGTITKYINKSNELGGVLEKHNTGVDRINKDAPARRRYIKERFAHYREEGLNLTHARGQANNDLLKSEFKYSYNERWLAGNLKD